MVFEEMKITNKKRIVFVDHSFHKRTASSNFFKDLLRDKFQIIELWNKSWLGKYNLKPEQINKLNPSIVLFWQSIPEPEFIRKLKGNIVFVPMYDQSAGKDKSYWNSYDSFSPKVICFSRKLYYVVKLTFLLKPNCYFLSEFFEFRNL